MPTKRAKPSKKAKQPASMMEKRADFGAPVDDYFAKQAPPQRALLEKLQALILKVAPDAKGALKWGRPFYDKDGPLAVLAAYREHVAITFFGSPKALHDPKGLLEGTGKAGKHLKVRTAADVDEAQITAWLKAAVAEPRSMATM